MKKILLFLFLIPVFAAAQKTTGGNYTYIAQRYEWLTGIFQAFNLPAGDSAQHKTGQDMRSGAVYLDTVNTQASPAGFYIYKNGVWELQADEDICQNRLIDPITVTYTGTGMRFFVSGGRYQIGCNFYYLDSATITLGDGESNPRIDNIILTATGVDTLKGVEAASPVKPQVSADEIELTFVNIAAAATTPTIITHIIYDENTGESTVTNSGTTTDPDNTTNVYRLTKSLNVTSLTNGDQVIFTLPSPVNLVGYDALSLFIKLKAAITGPDRLFIRFGNGSNLVSSEATLILNNSSLSYQGISTPMSAFSFSNTIIDKIIIRTYTTSTYAGFYLDYMHLVGGLSQPGGGNQITIGSINGVPKSPNGGVIANDKFHQQTADSVFPGLLSPTLYTKLNNQRWEYFIRNLGSLGDSIAVAVNDSTVGIKKFRVVGATAINTDTTFGVDLSAFSPGGGGISEVIAGYGLTNVNDSTLDVDSLVIANRDWVMDRISEIDTANIIVEPLPIGGTDLAVIVPRNDTLYHRLIATGHNYILVDTLSDGRIRIRLDTASSSLKAYIAANAAAGGTIGGSIATGQVAVGSGTNTIAGSSALTYTSNSFNNTITSNTSFKNFVAQNTSNGTSARTVFPFYNDASGTGVADGGQLFYNSSTFPSLGYAFGVWNYENGPILFATNNAERIRILAGGNVGIGITAPARLLHSEVSDATTNTVVYPFRISHITSLTNAIGSGVGIELENENASGTNRVTGSITNPYTDATNATEDADFAINLIRAGTLTEAFRATSVGGISVNGSTGTAGQVLTSGGTGAASTWSNPVKPTLTKNATIENPTASENMGWFRTPVAITITNTHAVLVGSSTPSVTYQISFGTDITSLTDVYTAGQTVTSTTTGTAASGVNDATIPANSWIRITTSAQSGTVGQISLSITYTED